MAHSNERHGKPKDVSRRDFLSANAALAGGTFLSAAQSVLVLPLALGSGAAVAQTYPSKPLRLIAPSPPGSVSDIIARVLAQQLSASLGQQMIVDNRSGASGALAATAVANAPADGYTVLLATDSMLAINPFIYAKLSYDPRKDFQPISLLAKTSLVMVVNPRLGVKTLEQLVQAAKANPRAITFGSGGSGHPSHLAMELINARLGIEMTHVPYKGASAMQALIVGEVDTYATGLGVALTHIKSGRAIPLVVNGPGAKQLLPGVPELKDLYPDLDLTFWFALLARAGTSAEVIRTLNQAVSKAIQSAELNKRMAGFGITPLASTPAELDALTRSDLARYGAIVKALGINAE